MNVLITGCAGHLGSRLSQWILDNMEDVNVYGVDDLSCGYVESIPSGVVWGNVCLGQDDGSLGLLFAEVGFDYVFHFAAYAAECLSPFCRMYNYRNNVLATADVVNCCLQYGVRRLVYTSSIAVYGANDPPFGELLTPKPIDPYGVAKAACECDIQIAGEQHGLDWCILRPHNIFGPYQSIWQDYRNVFGIWMSRHLQGMPLQIHGDGKQVRAFTFIDDILPCIWLAATHDDAWRQVINLGGRQPRTIVQAAEMLRHVMLGGEIVHTEPRHEVREAWCTWDKSEDILGFSTETPLDAALALMWGWAIDAWERYPERRGSSDSIPIEIDQGLYSFWKRNEKHQHQDVSG